jgi:SecD/SecF fusion protein
MSDRRRHGLILLVVAGLIAASVVLIATKKTVLGLDLKGGVELVYEGKPTPQQPVVNEAALQRAVNVMENRVNQLGVTQPQIQTEGHNLIDVQLPDVKNVAQAEREVGTTAQLFFYDWEANALTPAGTTVASGLYVQDSASLLISQADGGEPGSDSSSAGALTFYAAVKLAAKQPFSATAKGSRIGSEYFMFGAPGSSACKALAAAAGKKPQAGVHCLVSGPLQVPNGAKQSYVLGQLKQGLSKAETTGTQVIQVKQGTTVLEASPSNFNKWPPFGSPQAGYYVVRDRVALTGAEITNPEASTDQTGEPDVTFGFTGKGSSAFQSVTATLAHRGQLASTAGSKLYQHFAVALDDQLVTVPSIDFNTYPDGLTGGGGSEITGGFTSTSASQLATELRLGALPIKLVKISESQVSSTLGAQALHDGLIAGVIGLVIVIIFLLVFYRVLGLIAVSGLFAYGLYFFALIKLIPITMTLAGIAGLILTIGVAADANIVIFERVKEEIRAGRSVRQGIITGYRKGLTAIIDANVVTIMTAFILFVLATSDVKGFAFTLGIGVIVSLFTAVLATQAILMTLGDSKTIQSPSALGAGGPKRHWRFDFMGSSRYFFSMSGVILLVGALAIGGRGLNLGIDFTSGTQLSFGLERPASVNQIKTLVEGVGGGGDATVQAVKGDKALGSNAFQISSRYLATPSYDKLRNEVQNKYGIRGGTNGFNSTSVGPTFGSSVTKSAVIAIIISLLAISLYVALRFDWKFALPVLIALMHDILISVGVYALTGRVVTTDTVAAILTILGYSMYDTIIVFDRVRENIPRMPRAAFSQIVNRSMSEVLTRSIATTSCTLIPIAALLLFGGAELKDFAFALLIGVASGAYSSIFIASPVLTHWKEREHGYSGRRARIIAEHGFVPPYAEGGDVDPTQTRARRLGRITSPADENVSNAEFEQMKRDLGIEIQEAKTSRRRTSSLAQRTSLIEESELPDDPIPTTPPARQKPVASAPPAASETPAAPIAPGTPVTPDASVTPGPETPGPETPGPETPGSVEPGSVGPAPDVAENDGVARVQQGPAASRRSKNRSRRRHGRK